MDNSFPHEGYGKRGSFHRPDHVSDPLYVIAPLFNPVRFRKRWMLFNKFIDYILSFPNVHLYTVEAAFGDREFVIDSNHERHTTVRVRTNSEIWIKENLINVGISKLPPNWRYVSWIDADIQFARQDWVGETIQQLQHYDYVQMFSRAHDLDDKHEIVQTWDGFAYCYHHQDEVPPFDKKGYYTVDGDKKGYWHPGFCHAATRKFVDSVGSLIDWTILGGGDTYMMYGVAQMLTERTMPKSLGESGVRWLREWENRAVRGINLNFGYVDGSIIHHYHGKRAERGYEDRGQILVNCQFDPELDLKKDWQGLWVLTERNPKLRDAIRAYFRRRNEDS